MTSNQEYEEMFPYLTQREIVTIRSAVTILKNDPSLINAKKEMLLWQIQNAIAEARQRKSLLHKEVPKQPIAEVVGDPVVVLDIAERILQIDAKKCRHCQVDLELGYVQPPQFQGPSPSRWGKGEFKAEVGWQGNGNYFRVEAYRCPQCGLIEFYATEKVKPS